ncbi:Lrp/AsnC family transcriptional regulator [Arcobacter sp. LA11]|uniref:siroheme decarboxylase subunit alpha n=1 Tax=Arcobacter sp. LA11 TaxID=1898176 RepID=UPI000932923B|nr:Lrp/AsnC family transcriptional regulator [Arcobacter sp. LA11]
MKDEILYRVQKNFPLTKKPFEQIAKELNTTEENVLNILKEEKKNNIIRQTSAIFDTKKLGYKSSLVAFEIEEKDIDAAVAILNSHPGISHNYERNHSYNIWFTLAIAPNSKSNLEETVEILSKLTNAKDYIILPTLKLFKISVKLDTTNKQEKKEKVAKKDFKELVLNEFHYDIIKEAQNDIAIISEPFKDTIEKLNISYEEFFNTLKEFQEAGVMRRFACILNHRRAGFNANAMVVWDIEEGAKGEEIGKVAASFSAVSHCYLRPKYPTWNYNLFTMIHGKTKEDTQEVINNIAKEIDYKSNMPLYSSREFKKVRIKYFCDEFKQWEEKYIN